MLSIRSMSLHWRVAILISSANEIVLISTKNGSIWSKNVKHFITHLMSKIHIEQERASVLSWKWCSWPQWRSCILIMSTKKIGIFPLVYNAATNHSSKNRLAGTMDTKRIKSVNNDVTKWFLYEHMFSAIRALWPKRSACITKYGPIKISSNRTMLSLTQNLMTPTWFEKDITTACISDWSINRWTSLTWTGLLSNSFERYSCFSTSWRQTTSMSWSNLSWICTMQWATTSWWICSCRCGSALLRS